ncbi:MAG: hypothetical protein C5B52_06525 [Bacteroidetes bacterium]|nr:MAG: hypothetical protein C5B52_06525 [Bacteroidota bacterium]
MYNFSGKILKIGVNPYVLVPESIRKKLFKDANKDRGAIPVCGELNGFKFTQNLVKYKGRWRLYLNTPMRKGAGIDVGDMASVALMFDGKERITEMHSLLKDALNKNISAKKVFDQLPPSRQKEIKRYINNLKTEESVRRNIERAIKFLNSDARFIGRDKPL